MKRSVCLVMIVKNEARGIVRTLQSVRDHVWNWVILDTGSTDGTQQMIRDTMRGVPGELFEGDFVDYSTTRNHVLDLGESTGAGWCLMLSGDGELQRGEGLEPMAAIAPADVAAIRMPIKRSGLDYDANALTRSGTGCRYRGVTHEVMILADGQRDLSATRIAFRPPTIVYTPDESKCKDRWMLDAKLLEGERRRDPSNMRTLFYLAQTYECLGNNRHAAKLYVERLENEGGFSEERFISALRVGRCLWRLGRAREEIVFAYEVAKSFGPARAEPLTDLRDYYLEQGDMMHALVCAREAAAIPYPRPRAGYSPLFVERDVYAQAGARLAMIEGKIKLAMGAGAHG